MKCFTYYDCFQEQGVMMSGLRMFKAIGLLVGCAGPEDMMKGVKETSGESDTICVG